MMMAVPKPKPLIDVDEYTTADGTEQMVVVRHQDGAKKLRRLAFRSLVDYVGKSWGWDAKVQAIQQCWEAVNALGVRLKAVEDRSPVVGKDGLSAYQLAVTQGYSGTLSQWLVSLIGPKGEPGRVFLNDAVVTQSVQGGALAAGFRQVKVEVPGVTVGDRVLLTPKDSPPTGYMIGDVTVTKVNELSVTVFAPLLIPGASYSVTCKVTVFR
jgi:hypothetical protein